LQKYWQNPQYGGEGYKTINATRRQDKRTAMLIAAAL